MSDNLVIYHDQDLDGWTSGWIARRMTSPRLGATDALGYDYNREVGTYMREKIERCETLYLVDISLPDELMKQYAEKIVWIDHHKDRNDRLRMLPFKSYFCDAAFSATRLAFGYFYRTDLSGFFKLVNLVDTYDLWKTNANNFANSRNFNQAVLTRGRNIYWLDLDKIYKEGRSADGYIEDLARRGSMQLEGIDAFLSRIEPIPSHPSVTVYSLIAPQLSTRARTSDILVMFKMEQVGRYKVSLRSYEANVCEIAKRYGGGGHVHAAGFHCNHRQLTNIIKYGLRASN